MTPLSFDPLNQQADSGCADTSSWSRPPLLADVASGGKGQLPRDCFEVLSLPGAHGASPFGWNPPGGTPGGPAHVTPLLKISYREARHYQACRQAG
jgi:hypothetical protein